MKHRMAGIWIQEFYTDLIFLCDESDDSDSSPFKRITNLVHETNQPTYKLIVINHDKKRRRAKIWYYLSGLIQSNS